MSTELSWVKNQLALPTRDIVDLVDRYTNYIERETWNSVVITTAIPEVDRNALHKRLCEINQACVADAGSKHERGRIDKAVSYMISMFSVGRSVSAIEAAATAKGYVMALDGVPPYFVELACMDFVRGRVSDHDNAYTPTSAEVRVRAEKLMEPYREEGAKIKLLLTAKTRATPTPSEHERLLAKTRAVIDGTDPDIRAMRERVEKERADARMRAAMQIGRSTEIQRRRMCAHYGADPDSVASPALVKKIAGGSL